MFYNRIDIMVETMKEPTVSDAKQEVLKFRESLKIYKPGTPEYQKAHERLLNAQREVTDAMVRRNERYGVQKPKRKFGPLKQKRHLR